MKVLILLGVVVTLALFVDYFWMKVVHRFEKKASDDTSWAYKDNNDN